MYRFIDYETTQEELQIKKLHIILSDLANFLAPDSSVLKYIKE